MIYRTQEEAEAGLAKWQKLLRMQDWDLTVHLVGRIDLPDNRLGQVRRIRDKQLAAVDLLRADDWREMDGEGGQSVGPVSEWCHETALVHELIHAKMLLFEPKDFDSLEWNLCERFVEDMAQCYIRLERAVSEFSPPIPCRANGALLGST
jgi:hypothetical protein